MVVPMVRQEPVRVKYPRGQPVGAGVDPLWGTMITALDPVTKQTQTLKFLLVLALPTLLPISHPHQPKSQGQVQPSIATACPISFRSPPTRVQCWLLCIFLQR